MVSAGWAQSLVGRDWEIWWNDEEENDVKETNDNHEDVGAVAKNTTMEAPASEDDKRNGTISPMDLDTATTVSSEGSAAPAEPSTDGREEVKEDKKESQSDDENESDSDGEGSIIDDWYAGRVLSFRQRGATFQFKILFVGDENIYEMVLGQSKVRPSASGWIKRTKELLRSSALPSDDTLPPDTSMDADQDELIKLKSEMSSKTYRNIRLPKQDKDLAAPSMADLDRILHLRYLLRKQIYLRSRLARIENHAGSAKYVDGEPNPTETYVNHLIQCCRDIEQLCDWFCQCWDLLVLFFGEQSNSCEEANSSPESRLTIDQIVSNFFEMGKNVITNSLSINVDSTAVSKRRRHISSSPQKGRLSKRRRKNAPGPDDCLSMGSSNFAVERLLATITDNSTTSFLPIAGKMIHTVSHFIVDPGLNWRERACQLLRDERLEHGRLQSARHEAKEGRAARNTEDNDSESGESNADDNTFYTYEEIESAVAILGTSPVLTRLDWTPEKEKLESKLQEIVETELSALDLLCQIADEKSHLSKDDDTILNCLRHIVEKAADPENYLFNVNPIGRASSPVTREVLADGIELRSWLLDVWHTELGRERTSFVENLRNRLLELPDLSEVAGFNSNADVLSTIAAAKSKLQVLVESALSPSTKEMASIELWPTTQNPTLVTVAGVDEALAKMKTCLFILPVEEKLAVRRDVLLWGERARSLINLGDGIRIDFQQLEILSVDLQSILKGRSKTRMELVKNVYPSLEVERELERFGSSDVVLINGPVVQTASSLFARASQWKIRSQSIIDALCMHGNRTAGEAISTQKIPPMVDIKRINDLTEEYKTMQVGLCTCIIALEAVEREATQWNRGLYQNIIEQDKPLGDCLPFLLKERDLRPSGIIMDPTRQALDSLVDALTWYRRVKDAISKAASEIISLSVQGKSESEINQEHSLMTVDSFYPLLVEGIELVETFARNAGLANLVQTSNVQHSLEMLENFGFRRSAKSVNLEKIRVHPLGSSILSRLVGSEADAAQGSPLFLMGWYSWHLLVGELISSCEEVPNYEEGEKDTAVSLTSPSLKLAKDLIAQQPRLESASGNTSLDRMSLMRTKTLEVAKLERLISSAESAEIGMRTLLSQSKELLKAGIQKAEMVQQHLTNLKQSYAELKSRTRCRDRLSLDTSLEAPIDHHVKIFTWLVRTFPYPFMHLDEASYNNPVDHRVPWNVLVSLNERLPHEPDAQVGAFALVSLRVRELYETGKKWQDEITRNTALTSRGGKRRAPGGNQKSEQDPEATSKLQLEKMKQLAEHPILSKVAMPRETAVNGIFQSSTDFETQLHDFLGQDYEGANPDRASFPESDSLVGKKGEFILYRLTGSPLFEELQARVHRLGSVAENVLAETPGKATFEWIMGAVSWIESLSDAVTVQSPFKDGEPRLTLPSTEAKAILQEGEQIFLVLPDDLKRTLSTHGIFVTTNKQDETIRVTLKKDGAQHSCGGTVIRWCPILFEALKADVRRLKNWESALTKILGEFNAFFRATRDQLKNDDNLYTWFSFQEQVAELLEYGQESLVIAPPKPFVTSFHNLLNSFRKYLAEQSSSEKNEKFATKWLAESSSILNERSLLLHSLLYRKSILEANPAVSPTETTDLPPDDSFNLTFRDSCRSFIEKAFCKALKISGVSSLSRLTDVEVYCATKAWEIEDTMFERFQGEYGTSRISEDYRDKARSLRWSLEAKSNVSLCFRILIGELDSEALIDMSSEDLSSQKAKLDRAKAEQAAKSSALLTPGYGPTEATAMQKSETDKSDAAKDQSSPSTNDELPGKKDANGRAKVDYPTIESSDSTQTETPREAETLPTTKDVEMRETSQIEERSWGASSVSPKAIAKAVNKSRPPPPPSLMQSYQQSSETADDSTLATASRDRGRRFLNSTGGDRFRIEIINLRLAFTAAFYLEDEALSGGNAFVPEVLSEKGRLKIEEFSRFLTDKLSGGRWAAIPLRLAVLSDQDMKLYKKFYKEYEVNRRIAMFSITQNTKVFLVTPKFHGAAKSTGFISLPHKTSTYAIVLTKEASFVDYVEA